LKDLPSNVKAYKKTPIFTSETVPDGLLKTHRTMKGTWGKICVIEGLLRYTIESSPSESITLSSDHHGVVEPEVPHHVEPIGYVEFFIEFYK